MNITAEHCRKLGREHGYDEADVETFIANHEDRDGDLVAYNISTGRREVIHDKRWLNRLLSAFCQHRKNYAKD